MNVEMTAYAINIVITHAVACIVGYFGSISFRRMLADGHSLQAI
jgi:hypothetical protein